MLIFSDFSDTIAKPIIGDKFPPFELELGKLAGVDVSAQYEHFLYMRKAGTIEYEEIMQIWLKPLINRLTLKHIEQLVSTFSYNENFSMVVELLKNKLHTKSLEITITSGTLWQIIDRFLKGRAASEYLKRINVKFKIGATKILFNEEGKYDGQLFVTDKLTFAPTSLFPEKCLIIGDNAMENYGFGQKLLNVQNFNTKVINKRIEIYLNQPGLTGA